MKEQLRLSVLFHYLLLIHTCSQHVHVILVNLVHPNFTCYIFGFDSFFHFMVVNPQSTFKSDIFVFVGGLYLFVGMLLRTKNILL